MQYPLSGAAVRLELGDVVSDLPCDHLLVSTKLHQNDKQFQACHISFQSLQEPSMVQRVIGLTKVQ